MWYDDRRIRMVLIVYICSIAAYFSIFYARLDHISDIGNFGEGVFIGIGSNLIFFGILGLATFIPTIINPKQEPIERRLEFLITSDKVSKIASDYIRDEIKLLCAYIQTSDVTLTIKSIDFKSKRMLIDHRCNSIVKNTFKSETYTDENFPLIVCPDDVGLTPCGEVDFGEVLIEGAVIPIVEEELVLQSPGRHERSVAIRIPPDGTAHYRFSCWLWCTTDLPYFVHHLRFAESCNIKIVNRADCAIDLIRFGEKEKMRLEAGASTNVNRVHVPPGMMNVFVALEP